ncbi:MAG TPA: hypothetical protein VG455_10990, partial [Acidimicrobiales bacterium]|nr:hypothetical protein [Acidimicrobiales bacterium]
AVVVKGEGDGRVTIIDGEDDADDGGRGTGAGATIGAVLGISTAPAEVVVGESAGAIISAVLEIADVEDSEAVAANIIQSVPPRKTAVLAVLSEPTRTALDRLAIKCGAELVRRPRADVDRDVAAVKAAELSARRGPVLDRPVGERIAEVRDALREALKPTR